MRDDLPAVGTVADVLTGSVAELQGIAPQTAPGIASTRPVKGGAVAQS
ncbi:MAG TPA: hypothetical protein VJX66_30070 [Amycolatopsis sp.]|nr:hypothetical protein [Amycolatopsis sp.]